MMTKTATTPDPTDAALAHLTDAGISFTEVERCPDAACPSCIGPALPAAA